jgi:hypothetical protein
MANVQLSLFKGNAAQLSSTLASLEIAISSAAGVSPSSVSIRRVRDISDPFAPILVWTNPQFAGDVFPARRRLQGGATGSVSIDIQINAVNNAAAASLSATLAASSQKLASDVKQSLADQGSPLATAQITATVEPYIRSEGTPTSSSSQSTAIGVTIPVLLCAIAVTSYYLWVRYKKFKSLAKVAPEDLLAKKEAGLQKDDIVLSDIDDPTHLANHNDSDLLVNDLKVALKAQLDANQQERMSQLKALKAKVAKLHAIRSDSVSPSGSPSRQNHNQAHEAGDDAQVQERMSHLKALKAKVASNKLEASPVRNSFHRQVLAHTELNKSPERHTSRLQTPLRLNTPQTSRLQTPQQRMQTPQSSRLNTPQRLYNTPQRLHNTPQRLHNSPLRQHTSPQRVHHNTPQRLAWPEPKSPTSPPRSSVKVEIHSDLEIDEQRLAQLKVLKMKFSPKRKVVVDEDTEDNDNDDNKVKTDVPPE